MNKYILLIIILSFCASCQEKKPVAKKPAVESKKNLDVGGLYRYYHSSPTGLEQEEENKIIEYLTDNNLDAERTRSGIYITKHNVGEGDSIRWGDPIEVDYRGYFMNNEEFDSSIKRGEPIRFRVGSMVAGWNEALPFLKIGSKATFVIPSHMGYGKRGFPGFVGPDRILLFDIEVIRSTK